MEIVEILWIDAVCEQARIPMERVLELKPVSRHTVGYLLQENEDSIIVAFDVLEDGYRGLTGYEVTFCCPKVMVQEIRRLK